ncbi:DUF86 domain-containing protein [Patescibacteria group bacterium]|nr:DUF86 domain-containing protein [Patescibacteria group bacterium]MBU4016717.1 DUF86 domain-containing protein [Patescibacteria group bacterium]MBU4098998.1 DUF86 domain-containing protein [Patescibacteria group bacterium]
MKRDPLIYIQDMLESIEYIKEDTQRLSEKEFSQARIVQQAVVRNIEIMGEAAQQLPKEFKVHYPTIPWRKIAATRNKIIHEYFGLKIDVIWKTIQDDLPELKRQLEQILKDYPTEEK